MCSSHGEIFSCDSKKVLQSSDGIHVIISQILKIFERWKNCQEHMEEIKDMVEEISMFQKNHVGSLEKIHEMSLQEKGYFI